MATKPPKYLLAKSYDTKKHKEPPAYALLERHTLDVIEAGEKLIQSIGDIAFKCTDLDADDFAKFSLALKVNCFAQDLGKANDDFYEMVTKPRGEPSTIQLLWHEAISGLLLTHEKGLKVWFEKVLPHETLRLAALWGAMGHHRRFHDLTKPTRNAPDTTLYVAHNDFKKLLEQVVKKLNVRDVPLPSFARDLVIAEEDDGLCDIVAIKALKKLKQDFEGCAESFTDEKERRMIALIKAFGIASDVAASAVAKPKRENETKAGSLDLPENKEWDYSLAHFVRNELESADHCLTSGALDELISAWREKQKERVKELDEFQDRVEHSAAASNHYLTLVRAGCGSGKSLAAYRWARQWCALFEGEERRIFRLFFLLPTTGTATEQFKDYALESGIDNVRLTHSRSMIDLERIIETAEQEDASEKNAHDKAKAARDSLKAQQDKIEALNLWSTPLIVGTSDTVLGLMANSLRSICSLPAIITSAIVFDEIHAYDEQMFGHLLIFLKNFPRLPVLLMTASLPDARFKALRQVRGDLTEVPGPAGFETLPRYFINDAASDEEVWRAVEDCVRANGKVLWVRNTVERANTIYEECMKFEAKYGAFVDVYHSRFIYDDRVDRHNDVIAEFKAKNKHGVILVATQVAEMSLDLSADLLITDIAPIPSLIQRMGRLNRRLRPDKVADITKTEEYCKWTYVRPLPPNQKGEPDLLPYEKEDFDKARAWLRDERRLASTAQEPLPLSQDDLAKKFMACDAAGANGADFNIQEAEQRAYFFSGLWETKVGMTRGAGYTVTVILQQHYKKWKENHGKKEPSRDWLRAHEVSIPFRDEVLGWLPRIGGLPVAPSARVKYDLYKVGNRKRGTGAEWVGKRK